MSDKAETVTCEECGGKGEVLGPLDHALVEKCGVCSGTGVRTTGAVVASDGIDRRDAWGRKYGEPQPAAANATGHDGCIRGPDEAKGTIAAQAAEIERLKASFRQQMQWADNAAARKVGTDDAVLADAQELRNRVEQIGQDRDVLRLEVQRLKDLNFESQERDEARAEIERLKLRLTESLVELGAAEKEIAHMRESNGRADDYSAKLERVIEALRYELAVVEHCHAATIRSIVRLANAELELPEEPDNG